LGDVYSEEEAVVEFVETWRVLLQNSQYYKALEKLEKKNVKAEKTEGKEIERMIGVGKEKAKEVSFMEEYKEIRERFLEQSKLNEKEDSEFLTMESLVYSSKNKENLVDRMKEKEIVNRLYQNDKYQNRLALKKVKD
jgi:hypothetical protein